MVTVWSVEQILNCPFVCRGEEALKEYGQVPLPAHAALDNGIG